MRSGGATGGQEQGASSLTGSICLQQGGGHAMSRVPLARDAFWKGVAHTGPHLYRRWCGWALNEKVKLKKWQGDDQSADAKADLALAQQHGQEHLEQFKRRLEDNGVTGFSETITLHVAKTAPGGQEMRLRQAVR